MSDRENHGMNCAYRADSDEPCTCGVVLRIALQTEQTMHTAWRKRAEEAERENADLRARLEAVTKDRDNELADNTGLALKIAAVSEELDNFKAIASRETSRRLEAEKARDEQAEAVRVLAAEVDAAWEWNDAFPWNRPDTWDHATAEAVRNNPTAAAAVKEAGQ